MSETSPKKRALETQPPTSPTKRPKTESVVGGVDLQIPAGSSHERERPSHHRRRIAAHGIPSPSESSYTSSSSLTDEGSDESTDESTDKDSSAEVSEEESESDSDVGPSPTASAEEEEAVPILITRPKPPTYRLPTSDLSSRLAAFLPSLKAANEDLEKDIAAGRTISAEIPDDGDGDGADADTSGQYIELDLGLGVLEEQQDQSNCENSSSSDDEDTSNEKTSGSNRGVLDRLMGNKSKTKKPVIEEVVNDR